jgi:anion-transporting  ArsA/GET3 family ATPase
MSSFADKRFLIVTGKGGVGKTTVCAAEAIALAAKGKRVLVAMCNAKERLSAMMGSDLIGEEVVAVGPNIWAVNMSPEKALEEYGMLTLKSRALYTLLFDNKYVRTFFRAVPGMSEWTMLGKAWWHTTETRPDGSWRFDVVILDAPATGHGLDMLAWKFFQDPKSTAVILVTLPEEMPTSETIELAAALTGELHLPIGKVVVNGVLPPLFSREERATLEGLGTFVAKTGGEAALSAGRDRATRERVQAESLKRLSRELPVMLAFLPLLFEEAATPQAIRELAKRV